MRNYTILPALAAALLAAACDNDTLNDDPQRPGASGRTIPVGVTAGTPASDGVGTRTVIDIDLATKTFVTRWSDQDQMTVSYTYGDGTGSGDVPFTYDEASGLFRSELPDYTGAWTYDAFMPHRAASPKSAEFGNLRTQRGNDFNYAYDPLAATTVTTTDAAPGKDDAGGELAFAFTRLTSIVKVQITGGSASDKIRTVLLTATDGQPISSTAFDANGLATAETDGVSPQSNVIAMQFETGTQPGADLAEAYFNIPAGTYNRLQVDVVTEDGRIAGRVVNGDVAAIAGDVTLLNLENLVFRKVADYAQLQPTLEWPGQDMNAVHDITVGADGALTYDAAITIEAPAGIAGLKVDIVSDFLNTTMGISSLDIFKDTKFTTTLGDISYSSLMLKCSSEVQYKKSTIFDITNLVPMISAEGGAIHVFTVTITDLAGETRTQSLIFQSPITEVVPAVTYDGCDLNTNQAFFSVSNGSMLTGAEFWYKKQNSDNWIQVQDNAANDNIADDFSTVTISPEWDEYTRENWDSNPAWKWMTLNGSSEMAFPFYRIKPGTGIFANNIYDYKIVVNGKEYPGTFDTTTEKDLVHIQDGTFEDSTLSCFGTSNTGSTWWSSGNNTAFSLLGTNKLCTSVDKGGSKCAFLDSKSAVVLAAGNLFTGTFSYASMTGTVGFGQKYTWEARPTALKVDYHANIGTVNMVKHLKNGVNPIEKNLQDYARIFVAIVELNSRKTVQSGTSGCSGVWDPETDGTIIGYGSLWISDKMSATDAFKTVEIPINYFVKDRMPASNKYSIIISCSANAYGDYMCGCSSNDLYVDNFEWVY